MMGIKSEISKYEELLKEYQLYKRFLDDVSPEVDVPFILIGSLRVAPNYNDSYNPLIYILIPVGKLFPIFNFRKFERTGLSKRR